MKITRPLFTWFVGIITFLRGILGLWGSLTAVPSTSCVLNAEVKKVKTTFFAQKMQNAKPLTVAVVIPNLLHTRVTPL